MFGPSYFPEGVEKIIKQEKIEKGDEVQEDDGVKEGVQEDNGSKTHRMLSVLLADLAHWRYLLTADRLLLLLTDYCCCCRLFSPSAKSTVPIVLLLTDTNKRLHQKSILFGDQHFRILPKKEPCFKILFGQSHLLLYLMIEKYRSCLVFVMHLRGEILFFLATQVMAASY